MKGYLKIAAWISLGIALILMLIGIIAKMSGGILLMHWWGNYYYPAHNFLLVSVVLLLFVLVSCEKKEQ